MNEYERLMYLTRDGTLDIDFVFMDCGEVIGWRIYIISPINYGSRSGRSPDAHWLHEDGETYRYVCWSTRISTKNEAKAVAQLWSEATAEYIQKGGEFVKIAGRIQKELSR